MSNLIETPNQDFTFLGQQTHVQGNFIFRGTTRVAGSLKGEIRCESAPLSIEPTGLFEGTLFCHDLEIYGDVKGDIRSTGKVIIYPSASFNGQIQSSKIEIHPGSTVNMEAKTE